MTIIEDKIANGLYWCIWVFKDDVEIEEHRFKSASLFEFANGPDRYHRLRATILEGLEPD